MATFDIGAAADSAALSDFYNGVHICGRTSADARKFREKFRQLPQEPPPPDMRLWWELTEKYRKEWEKENEDGLPPGSPFVLHFLLTNRHPAELEDGADVVAPVFWVLASWDRYGRLQFAEEVMSGLICYGELKNPTRHSFSDLINPDGSEQKQAA